MVNRRQKGRRNEIKTRNALEAVGFDVILAPNPTKYSKQNDFFGLFDAIAISKNEVKLIQVKSNQTAKPYEREAIQEFECPESCSKELWIWKDRVKQPIIKKLN